MHILRHADPDFSENLRKLLRKASPPPGVEATVREILQGVRERGDVALLEYIKRFGGPSMKAGQLLETRSPKIPAKTARLIAAARRNVHAFARKSLRRDWKMKNAQGGWTGERFTPFERVGIYVPGGTAPLVSTAIMTVTLAAAAGVKEIVVTTPCDADGRINDALLHALRTAGATEIYKAGGAQAIAALAFGTQTVRAVQKIAGPGNAYVVEAKRQVFGGVSIDLLPGPSEVLVIADAEANPAWVAAELLAQAEHGKGSGIVLVTNSAKLLSAVQAQITLQSESLSRRTHLAGVLENDAYLVLVKSLKDAVRLCNDYAPEHVSLLTRDAVALSEGIVTAGAIFIGPFSPVAAGDFLAGPSHTLPTGGGGKSFPGLMADMFQRRTSWVRMDKKALGRSLPIISAFSELEGLDAHARSAAIRLESTEKPSRRTSKQKPEAAEKRR
jgi:histidinol dehydrogenase